MARIIETVDIDVPVDVAYNQWTQLERFPDILPAVERVEQLDDTRVRWTVSMGVDTRDFDTVITEQLPDERIAWTSTGGEVDHAGVVTFHRLDEAQCRVTVQIDWEPDNLAEKAASVLDLPAQKVKSSLKAFKDYLEAQGMPDGGWRGSVERPAP